jgi:hypothetical protein
MMISFTTTSLYVFLHLCNFYVQPNVWSCHQISVQTDPFISVCLVSYTTTSNSDCLVCYVIDCNDYCRRLRVQRICKKVTMDPKLVVS